VKFQRVSNDAHVWYEWHILKHGNDGLGYNVGGVAFRMATMTSSSSSSSSSSPVLGVKVKVKVEVANSTCGSGTGQGLFASVAMTTGQEVARMITPQREKSKNSRRIPWGGFIINGTDFIFDVDDESNSRQLWSYIQHSPNPNVKVTVQKDGAVVWVRAMDDNDGDA
jgi:hypothetical protein